MRLDITAFTIASAFLFGLADFVLSFGGVFAPGFAEPWLDLMAAIYPGYTGEPTVPQVLFATGYGALKGAALGFIFASVYNGLAPPDDG